MSSSSVKQESYRPPPSKTPFILVPDSNEIELVHNDPRPPKPSMPPLNSSPDAVHEFLILYFMSQSYSYRWSLLQARKFEGFDGEALHGLSEDEFFKKVGIYGQMLHGQLADARYGLVSFSQWLLGAVQVLICDGSSLRIMCSNLKTRWDGFEGFGGRDGMVSVFVLRFCERVGG